MSKKRQAAGKKSKKRIAKNDSAQGGQAPLAKQRASSPPRRASGAKQRGVPPEGRVITFAEAKSAAIDRLIETIEDAERRLVAVKQATSIEELERLAGGRAV